MEAFVANVKKLNPASYHVNMNIEVYGLVKMGGCIPRNEKWIHEPESAKELAKAIEWSASHSHREADLAKLERRLLDDDNDQA